MRWKIHVLLIIFGIIVTSVPQARAEPVHTGNTDAAQITRFCLEGEFDLGARYQGTRPEAGEFYPTTWCVITEDNTERVHFSGKGRSNPDMEGSWVVAYFPPGELRIINRDSPPDIEFSGADILAEVRSVRRLDPHRLLSEYFAHPKRFGEMRIEHADSRLLSIATMMEIPLRGRVSVVWRWEWSDPDAPQAVMEVDGAPMFRGTGHWEVLQERQAAEAMARTPGADPIQVPGEVWPSEVNMSLETLADGAYIVRGVRTGFQHLVVDTSEGLVIGDAPAGWVELHLVPPMDLVPGLGISGLSEGLIDFLKQELPGRPIAAVVLTHAHDDHAGGARAFAAEGARVYAPAAVEVFLERALNRSEMPTDRLAEARSAIDINPVVDTVTIGQGTRQARVVSLGSNPHVDAMLGLWAVEQGYFFVSDVHVPNSEADFPRARREVTECWFARTAVGLLPESVEVVNTHSGIRTPVSRLKAYLDSPQCRQVSTR